MLLFAGVIAVITVGVLSLGRKTDSMFTGPSDVDRKHFLRKVSAMKMAMRKGVDPYNSHPTQAKAYESLARMQGG